MTSTTATQTPVAAGDRLVVRAHFQGQPERDAEILEVLGADGPPYRVRWDDGRQSIILPRPGRLRRALPARATPPVRAA